MITTIRPRPPESSEDIIYASGPVYDEDHDTSQVHQTATLSRPLEMTYNRKPDMITPTQGDPIPLPEIVRQRPLLVLTSPSINTAIYPAYRGAPLLAGYSDGEKKHAYYDGAELSRAGQMGSYTRKKIFFALHRCSDLVGRGHSVEQRETQYQGLDITIAKHADWTYVKFQQGCRVLRFAQDDIGQFKHQADQVTMAFGYARAFLLTWGSLDFDCALFDEDEFAYHLYCQLRQVAS